MEDELVKTTPEDSEVPEMEAEKEQETIESPDSEGNPRLIELINRFAPDADTSSPSALNESALQVLEMMVPVYDKLYDLAVGSPESAAVLNDWLETGDLVKAIARNYGEEEKQALIEELDDEMYEEDRKLYSEKVKSKKDRDALVQKNLAASQMGAQEFVDEMGLTEEQVDKFKPYVDKFLQDCEDRNLSKTNWMILWDAYTKKESVAEAEEMGRIAGRNEKIVAEKKTRNDIKELLPEVNASAEIPSQTEKKKEDPFLTSLKLRASQKPILS